MLTKDEYDKILPFKGSIELGNAGKTALIHINEALIRLGYGSICFDCSGSVARAIRDITELIKEYEKNNHTTI